MRVRDNPRYNLSPIISTSPYLSLSGIMFSFARCRTYLYLWESRTLPAGEGIRSDGSCAGDEHCAYLATLTLNLLILTTSISTLSLPFGDHVLLTHLYLWGLCSPPLYRNTTSEVIYLTFFRVARSAGEG